MSWRRAWPRVRGADGRQGAGVGVRGTAHLRSPCGLRAERAALQAAVPGPGEPAGARGTGSERCAEGEIGAPSTAVPPPVPKGEGLGLQSPPALSSLSVAGSSPSECNFALDSKQEPPAPGPDITMLCDPETLFYESPHLTLDSLPSLRLQLRPRPSEDTFLMHRTLRRWEL